MIGSTRLAVPARPMVRLSFVGALIAAVFAVPIPAQTVLNAVRAYAIEDSPTDAAVADIDGDGRPEVIVPVPFQNSTYLYNVPGDGSLGYRTAFEGSGDGITPCDINGDGLMDFLFSGSDLSIKWVLNLGNGLFSPPRSLLTGAQPVNVDVGDVNHDGLLDVAVVHFDGDTAAVHLGVGNGNFLPFTYIPTLRKPSDVLLRDMNGDTHLDLLEVSSEQYLLAIHPGRGDGSFGAPTYRFVGLRPVAMQAVDLTGDGRLDLVLSAADSYAVAVMWNNGDGTVTPPAYYAIGEEPGRIHIADIENDGRPDVLVGGQYFTWIYRNNGDGTLAPAQQVGGFETMRGIATVHLDNDARLDIVQAKTGNGDSSVGYVETMKQDTFGRFPLVNLAITDISNMKLLASGDFSGDGRDDIVYTSGTNSQSAIVNVLRSLENGSYFRSATRTFTSPSSLAISDLDGDGLGDIIVGQTSGTEPLVTFAATGQDTFGTNRAYGYNGMSDMEVADLNADTRPDIAFLGGSRLQISLNDGAGVFPSLPNQQINLAGPTAMDLYDWDGDGDLDAIIASDSQSKIYVSLNDGAGSFGSPGEITGTGGCRDIAVGDFDGNDQPDIVLIDDDPLPRVFWNRSTVASSLPGVSIGTWVAPLLVADFNEDGRDDLACEQESRIVDVWLGRPNANFAFPQGYRVYPGPTSLVATDPEGDGDLDLMVGTVTAGSLQLLRSATPDVSSTSGAYIR